MKKVVKSSVLLIIILVAIAFLYNTILWGAWKKDIGIYVNRSSGRLRYDTIFMGIAVSSRTEETPVSVQINRSQKPEDPHAWSLVDYVVIDESAARLRREQTRWQITRLTPNV